ncbi:MAG: flagellar motor switch protein FliM [Lentisphaeraceae bacterium]|nr:flagellar motor switch protein FliM [Lentisphaeraceae bacterium]
MANILSQDEIDDLLGAMERGELVDEVEDDSNKRKIESFNFRRPNLIAGDKLRGFNAMHDQFIRKIQGSLTLLMRANIELNIASTDQIIFQEFVKSMDSVSLIRLFTMDPLPGTAIVEIKLPLAYGVVDMLLGGQGGVETEVRRMTEIEFAILEPFLANIEEQLASVWKEVVDVDFNVTRTETDSEMVQTAPSEAPMVVVTMVMKLGQANGIISVAYPLPMVQQLLNRLDSKNWEGDNYYGKLEEKNYRLDLMTAVSQLELPVYAELGNVPLTSYELQSLKVGDMLILDKKYSDLLSLNVGGKKFAVGRPGKIGRAMGLKLVNNHKEDSVKSLAGLLTSE